MTTLTKTCEACGVAFSKHPKKTYKEFATRRFCSKTCANRTVPRPGRVPGTHCRSGHHEMVGDNVRTDSEGRRRSCKACAAEKERERKARLRSRPVARRVARPKPTPQHVVPPIAVVSEQKAWRPAGWSAQPNIGRAS